MVRSRLWTLATVVAVLAILALAWTLGVQPQLASLASTSAQQAAVDARNAAEQGVLAQLEADAADATDLRNEFGAATRSIPFGTGLPDLYRQLDELAARAGVSITRITVGDPAAFVPGGDVGTPGEGQAGDPGIGDQAAPSDLSADPESVAPAGGELAYLQVGFDVEGSYARILGFVDGLQHGDRLVLVNSVRASQAQALDDSGTAAVDPNRFTATIGGYIFAIDDGSITDGADVDETEAAG